MGIINHTAGQSRPRSHLPCRTPDFLSHFWTGQSCWVQLQYVPRAITAESFVLTDCRCFFDFHPSKGNHTIVWILPKTPLALSVPNLSLLTDWSFGFNLLLCKRSPPEHCCSTKLYSYVVVVVVVVVWLFGWLVGLLIIIQLSLLCATK